MKSPIFLVIAMMLCRPAVVAGSQESSPSPVVSFSFINGLLATPEAEDWFKTELDARKGLLRLTLASIPYESQHLASVDHYRVTGRMPVTFIGIGSQVRTVRNGFVLSHIELGNTDRTILLRMLRAEWRREAYRLLIRLAAIQDSMEAIRSDLKLISLSLTASEHKYGLKGISHLELMHLQNIRTLQESQLVIHTNDLAMLENELGDLTWKMVRVPIPRIALPRHIVLGPKTISALVERSAQAPAVEALVGSVNRQRGLKGDMVEAEPRKSGVAVKLDIFRKSYLERLHRDIRRQGQLINSAGVRYAAFSDEIQLRNQEAVATASAELELGRADIGEVIDQRRKLLGDRMEMIRLTMIQHEALADLVFLVGLNTLEEVLVPVSTKQKIDQK